MKVERHQNSFRPVTITLETQLEVDALYVVIGKVAQGDSDINTMQWYNALGPFASDVNDLLVKAEAPTYGIGVKLAKNDAA